MKADPNEVIAFVEDPDGYRIELVQEMQPQLQADSGTVHMSNYLFFTTQCEQALAFYAQCGLGRVVEVMRYGADGVPVANEALRGKVMHAKFEGPGVLFYASDNDDAEPMRGSAHILMMTDRVLTLELFNRLVEGGTITTPIGVQAWGDYYGKATDQFGVQWMLNPNNSLDRPKSAQATKRLGQRFHCKNSIKQPVRIVANDVNDLALIAHFS